MLTLLHWMIATAAFAAPPSQDQQTPCFNAVQRGLVGNPCVPIGKATIGYPCSVVGAPCTFPSGNGKGGVVVVHGRRLRRVQQSNRVSKHHHLGQSAHRCNSNNQCLPQPRWAVFNNTDIAARGCYPLSPAVKCETFECCAEFCEKFLPNCAAVTWGWKRDRGCKCFIKYQL